MRIRVYPLIPGAFACMALALRGQLVCSTIPSPAHSMEWPSENIAGKTIVVNYNDLSGNTRGIYHGGTGTLNGQFNWWGSATGPGAVAAGSGVLISSSVDYCPWLDCSQRLALYAHGNHCADTGEHDHLRWASSLIWMQRRLALLLTVGRPTVRQLPASRNLPRALQPTP